MILGRTSLRPNQWQWASFSNAVKNLRRNFFWTPLPVDLGTNLAFMKVFSSGICFELQKNFRTRNSSRKSGVFLNAIPQKTTRCPKGPLRVRSVKGWICEKLLVIAFTSTLQTSSDLNNYNNNNNNNNKYENICIINNYVSHL